MRVGRLMYYIYFKILKTFKSFVVEEISTVPVVLFEDKFALRTGSSVTKQANLSFRVLTSTILYHIYKILLNFT
jgi:predicted component of viral defense system (DUF524 family)